MKILTISDSSNLFDETFRDIEKDCALLYYKSYITNMHCVSFYSLYYGLQIICNYERVTFENIR
jgi:hypothetical protein